MKAQIIGKIGQDKTGVKDEGKKEEGKKSHDNTMLILMPTDAKFRNFPSGPDVRTHALRVRNPNGEMLHEEHGKFDSCFVVRNGTQVRFYIVSVGTAIFVDLIHTFEME